MRPRRQPALDDRIGASGLPGASALRRHGRRLGIETVRDLLFHLPRRYDDLREFDTVQRLRDRDDGALVTSRLDVVDLRVDRTFRRRVERTTAVLRDATGTVEAVWFGRRYIERRLRAGDRVIASGRVRHRGWSVVLENPEFQRDDGGELLHAGRIVPVYRLTHGIATRTLRTAIRAALDALPPYGEYLDRVIIGSRPTIARTIESAHYPETFAELEAALERLAHDELLALQVGMVSRRRQRSGSSAPPVAVDDEDDHRVREAIVAALARRTGRDVALTDDQRAAMDAVRRDLSGRTPMLRLLQGDVGSGKTAVAAHALALAALAGRQAALLAPTDLLARQHTATIGDLVADIGVPVTLLTGSLSAEGRRRALAAIASGQAAVVVGTHAIVQEGVRFTDLAVAVIDEQHRFGVAQREALAAKGAAPHVLLMTATPIPRTLGQVLYADLDVTDLRTPPAGRTRIRTGIRRPTDLDSTWDFVRHEAAAGHRAFVVVPLIDAGASGDDGGALTDPSGAPDGIPRPRRPAGGDGRSGGDLLRARSAGTAEAGRPDDGDDADVLAAEAERESGRLRQLLAPLRVGMVHGRMRPAERDEEMRRFRDGELDVLVGTTVVEVGVDVPEATMMIVESADRFGLSQLHQLRGRVGRGTAPSYCVLVSDAADDSTAMARLLAVRDTTDGFELAERDLELRREGDVLGLVQSGLPRLRIASLQRPEHRALAVEARRQAEQLVDEAGQLRPGNDALAREMRSGWLAGVASGEVVAEGGDG